MKKRNKFYICLAILVFIGLIWSFIAGRMITKNFRDEILSNALQKQKVLVHGLIVTETKDGEKYWEIYAEEGQYNSTDKVVILNNIFGNFYKNGQVVMSFKSDQGSLTEETKKVVLYKNSLIVYKNGEYISADRITWKGKDEEITADGNILMEKKNQIRIRGQKAWLSPDWTNFKMKQSVTTELFGGEGIKL
ncbi:LPS export ABC transporter periplasmic protein LptC [bacterium]|nr:LPS export ABC transporter periplasmic protein LptC [bacterium]